jgi:membrane protease YdiL (CAAX protease family)
MRAFIRSLSPTTEFVIVIGVAFGPFIQASLMQAAVRPVVNIENAQVAPLLVYELVLLAALSTFLYLRGWTPARLGLHPHALDVVAGLGLAVAVHIGYLAASSIAALVFPIKEPVSASPSATVTFINVLTVSVINPVFEEVFVCGYVVTVLQKSRGPWTAINVSTTIRLLYHLYQGALGVLSIVPTGLIFAYWFARTGRLWPPIVAHGVLNFIVLLLA